MIDGLMFRCPLCRCLVIDLDRDAHVEALHLHAVSAAPRTTTSKAHHTAA